MSGSFWRQAARRVIESALDEAREAGLDGIATLKLIDSRYPFGGRECHPYAMWLKERRIAIDRERLPGAVTVVRGALPAYSCRFCRDAGCLVCASSRQPAGEGRG